MTKELFELYKKFSDIVSEEEKQLAFWDEDRISLINESREDMENVKQIFEDKEFVKELLRFQSRGKDQN